MRLSRAICHYGALGLMDPTIATAGTIAIILLMGSFVKSLTLLTIVRVGLGLHGAGFGLVSVLVALVVSLAIVEPHVSSQGGVAAILTGRISSNEIVGQLTPFVHQKADKQVRARIELALHRAALTESAAKSEKTELESGELGIELLAFSITQLKEAFQVGLALLLPFIVIDLIVINIMMVLSITQIPSLVISLPLKLLLFIAVDGWQLIIEKMVS